MADAILKFDAVLEGKILADLRDVQSKLESFTNKTYKVKLDLDDSQFQAKLQKAYDLQSTKKIPLLSMSKSLASMKQDLASVISPLQEIGRLVDSISKKDFNMSFNMGDMTKEATGRYIENVRDYVRGVTEAKKLVSEVSRDPTWRKAATPQDMAMLGRAVQAMGREGGELEKLDKRLNQVTTKAGAERVAKDVKAYYDTYLPIIERAQALGVSSVAGKKLGIFPEMPKDAVPEAQSFATALGLVQNNAQQATQALGQMESAATQATTSAGPTRTVKTLSAELDTQKKRIEGMISPLQKMYKGILETPLKDSAAQTSVVKEYQTLMDNLNRARNATLQGRDLGSNVGNLEGSTTAILQRVKALRADEQAAQSAAAAERELASAAAKSAQKDINDKVAAAERLVASTEKKYSKLNTGILGQDDKALSDYVSKLDRVKSLTEQARNLSPIDPNYTQTLTSLSTATDELGRSYETLSQRVKTVTAEQRQAQREAKAMTRQMTSTQSQIQKILDKNQRLAGTTYGDQLQNIQKQIQGRLDLGQALNPAELANYQSQIQGITRAAADAGMMGRSLGQTVVGLFKQFGGWQLVTHSMMRVINGFKQMLQNVRDLDAAMTELKKVTDLTDSGYEQFFERAKTRAKETGATLTDTINASADFSRLGYNISDAEKLADVAIVYKNVGDGIEDISTASESVISTMKAFGIEASDAMSVVDKFNTTGNKFAISSAGVGEALTRSASALAAGGNTLDESIALITAGNEVVQDPQKMGTTMKSISMFLRAAKTEASEAGIETDGMAESVSKLRGEILNLTGGKVDIQLDEDWSTRFSLNLLKSGNIRKRTTPRVRPHKWNPVTTTVA